MQSTWLLLKCKQWLGDIVSEVLLRYDLLKSAKPYMISYIFMDSGEDKSNYYVMSGYHVISYRAEKFFLKHDFRA